MVETARLQAKRPFSMFQEGTRAGRSARAVAGRGDALEVGQEEVAEGVHLRQWLPAERCDPAEQEPQDAGPRLVRPEAVERKAKHIDQFSRQWPSSTWIR